MPSYPVNHSLYVLLWNKYKPVLVKLMRDSEQAPKEYQFIPHEFRDLNAKEKGGHAFTLEAHRGRAINNIKMSVVAQDLIEILVKSATAYELMEHSIYEFKMDKQYLLTVTKKELKKDKSPEEAETPEVSDIVKEKEEA